MPLSSYRQHHQCHELEVSKEDVDEAIRYDMIEEFNVDSKAECDQINVAHVARKI